MQLKFNTKYLTAGGAIAAAAVTAHLMQSGDANVSNASVVPLASASAAVAIATPSLSPALEETASAETMGPTVTAFGPDDMPTPELAALVDPVMETSVDASIPLSKPILASADLPSPPQDTAMPIPLPETDDLQTRMAATEGSAPETASPTDETPRNQFGLACGPIVSASASNAAMVSLTLTAPCRSEQLLFVEHGDLTFSGQTNHLGTYTAEVPALERDAKFTIYFIDGEEASAEVMVPDVDAMDRVALLYSAKSGLEIHALEFGAEYDEDGHVWVGAARDVAGAAKAGGGFLTVLGDENINDAMMAQVYTFPSNTRNRDGIVRLSVEAEVTAYNCEKEIAGQTIERMADGQAKAVSLTLAMPECAAIGEFLVLKNLLQDLKIASN